MSPGYFYSPSQLGSTGANHPPHWGNHKLLFLPQVSNRQKRKEREKEREAIHNLQQGVYFLHAYRYIISFGGVWFGFSLFFCSWVGICIIHWLLGRGIGRARLGGLEKIRSSRHFSLAAGVLLYLYILQNFRWRLPISLPFINHIFHSLYRESPVFFSFGHWHFCSIFFTFSLCCLQCVRLFFHAYLLTIYGYLSLHF